MASVGDVFVTCRLDTTGFESGVSRVRRQAGTLNTDLKVAGAAVTDLGGGVEKLGGHFHNSAQSLARFAAISLEQVVPATDGSRVAVEGVFQSVGRLAGGYGTLAIVGAGVAATLGGILYTSLVGAKTAAGIATEGVVSLDDSLAKLEKNLESNITTLSRFDTLVRLFQGPGQGLNPATNIEDISKNLADPGGLGPGRDFGTQQRAAADRVKAARELIEVLRGAKLLEDPAAGGAVKKIAEADAAALFTLEKAVRQFVATSVTAAATDPLQKMLIADAKATQALIEQINALNNVTSEERQGLLSTVDRFGNRNQQTIRQGAAADVAGRLGLGDTNLFAGFRDIKQTLDDINNFKQSISDLSRDGSVPVSAIFEQIAQAQAKVDEKFAALREKFKDTPALFNKIVDAEREFSSGALQKTLDADVRGLRNLSKGGIEVTDSFADGATPAVLDFSAALESSLNHYNDLDIRVVILTEDMYSLARAFQSARIEALALAGATAGGGTTTNVSPPGNF